MQRSVFIHSALLKGKTVNFKTIDKYLLFNSEFSFQLVFIILDEFRDYIVV